jgi:hypothetical protein
MNSAEPDASTSRATQKNKGVSGIPETPFHFKRDLYANVAILSEQQRLRGLHGRYHL